jgi:archaeal flagellar protein FlaI
LNDVKGMLEKNKFIPGLLGKKGDHNSIAEAIKKARNYLDRPLRTLPAYDPEKEGPLAIYSA